MNRARMLAAPSVTSLQGDAEGLPNVILEAHAMHLPVVSTRHAGIPEAVRHGETGFLTVERDVATLARYTLDLLENDNVWQCFSEAGRRHMETHFDRVKQTHAFYLFLPSFSQ